MPTIEELEAAMAQGAHVEIPPHGEATIYPLPAALGIFMPGPQAGQMTFGLQMGRHAFTISIPAGATQAQVGQLVFRLATEISKVTGVASGGSFFTRLKLEHRDLAEKLRLLSNFLTSQPDALPAIQHDMLVQQKAAMTEYLAILAARIENIEHEARPGAERRPPMEGLEDGSAIRETGGHDQDRDGPVKFEG